MTNSLDVEVLGLRVRIELSDDVDSAQQQSVWQAWSAALSTGDAEPDHLVTFSAGANFDKAMERLTVDVTLAALDLLRGSSLLFHAAGIADEHGRTAAFVGPSGRGKTTLSRVLGAHYAYVTDETVSVGEQLEVRPYRKPLSVVRDGQPKQQVSPDQAGLRALPDQPLTLGALALLDRDPELQEPRIETLSLVSALPELVPQMSYLRDHPQPLQAIAAVSDALGGFRLLRYPDAATVPALVPELLNAAPAAPAWQPAPPAREGGTYRSNEVIDALLTDGCAIVMAGSTVRVLDGIAPTVWLAARAGEDLDSIVESVLQEFGAPPTGDAHDLVSAAIDELIAGQMLARTTA